MFAIIIFDGDKCNIFEGVIIFFHFTYLVSKMVRDYGFVCLVCTSWSCRNFGIGFYFVRTIDSRNTKGGDSYRIFLIVCI